VARPDEERGEQHLLPRPADDALGAVVTPYTQRSQDTELDHDHDPPFTAEFRLPLVL
jgi:hypothetical protein